MITSRPPLAATWLLRYLSDTPHFDSIIGDLEEFYFEGRSRAWYWRQTLVALTVQFVRDIWTHKLLALRALFAAWALMPAYNVGRLLAVKALTAGWDFMSMFHFTQTPGLNLFETTFREIPRSLGQIRSAGSPHLVAACAILILIALIFGAATSALLSRLHPKHYKTMIVLYALTMLVTVLPNAGSYAITAYTTRTIGSVLHVLVYCANNTALITGIIAGGFLYNKEHLRNAP